MSNVSDTPKLSPESMKALEQQSVKQKLAELENVSRLSVNTLNLICSNDVKIPSAYAKPVAEIQDWLTAIHSGVQPQIETLKALLPKDASAASVEGSKAGSPDEAAKQAVVDQGSGKEVKLEEAR